MTASAFNRLHALMFASLTLASSALAGVYITNPVSNTTARPGERLTIRWVDDGTTPHLASIGPSQIALYTGSPTQQTLLQQLAANIDVSTTNSLDAWIDSNIGPNGEYYFIRITSNSLKDAAQPRYPYQSYSARFMLNNMNGDFNSSVWQQLTASPATSSDAMTSANAMSVGASSQMQSVGNGNTANASVTSGSSGGKVEAAAATASASMTSTFSGSATSAVTSTSQRSSSIVSETRTSSASTTQSSSAAGTRLSAPFSFKAPQILARANQPGSPEGRTAALMVTSVLFGVFGFGLAVAL